MEETTVHEEPRLMVGVHDAPKIHLTLDGPFIVDNAGKVISGNATAHLEADGLTLETESGVVVAGREVMLSPADPLTAAFTLHDVIIGRQFHWQRPESQRFRGGLRLLRTGQTITTINAVGVEDYLTSVISSEMSAEGAPEFLKAHAVTSRSWLLAQLAQSHAYKSGARARPNPIHREPGRLIRWYDREDHDLFDVCADDHCQRYQGVTKAYTQEVEQAVRDTRGTVLMQNGEVCDARFSKSCGGVTELFENAWEPVHHPYLVPVLDAETGVLPDLTDEALAAAWIASSPQAFCNVQDPNIIGKILPRVDRETQDFYRWTVRYGQQELADLIREKTGIDVGAIKALTPVQRGASGRMVEFTISGTKQSMTIGKDLEVRRVLSRSHLYSSAFVVSTEGEVNGVPEYFVLRGAGWGHGVGLCQIGAGVMGEKGYSCVQILAHYFPGAQLQQLYE